MGNLPVIKDLVVDMEPFWGKFRAVKPWLEEDGDPPVKEWRVQQEELDRIFKEALCIQCGCCVSECNSMEADPDFLGPAALAKAARFVGDARDRGRKKRLQMATAPTACGTAPAATSAMSAAPRASTRATRSPRSAARSTPRACSPTRARGTRKVFDFSTHATGYLLETALVPYTDPMKALDVKFALKMVRAGKAPNPLKPHRAKKLGEVRALSKLVKEQEKESLADKRTGVTVDRENES